MYTLPFDKRVSVVNALVEGTSQRAAARLNGIDRETVMYLAADLGHACIAIHDEAVIQIEAKRIECDECWSFIGKHEKCVLPTDPAHFGDAYTLFGIDRDTKLIISFVTGERSLPAATDLMYDLRRRVVGHPQITVDGWPHWAEAVRRTFGHNGCDLGQSLKEYRSMSDATCAGSRIKSMAKRVLYGNPDADFISTAIAERANLTARMHQRRLTRLTNGYSKKLENHVAAIGLHFAWYNFVRIHETIGTTPAVAAGIMYEPMSLAELVEAALYTSGIDETGETAEETGDESEYEQEETDE
jgi:IS1 family transposase